MDGIQYLQIDLDISMGLKNIFYFIKLGRSISTGRISDPLLNECWPKNSVSLIAYLLYTFPEFIWCKGGNFFYRIDKNVF